MAKPFLLIAVIVCAVYGATLGHGFFAWDDDTLVYENPIVQEVSLSSVARAFSSYDPELYVPLAIVSFQLEHLLAGNRPFLYHLDNVLLHAANAALVFLLLRRLLGKDSLAYIGALLFAVHPLQAEAVSWVAARKDLLAGFFFLATLIQYLRYKEQPTGGRYASALLLFLAALFSKVTVIGLPFVLLLLDWFQGHPLRGKTLMEKIPFVVLSVIFGIVAIGGKAQNVSDVSAFETLLLGAKDIAYSLKLFFFPFPLLSIYRQTGPISALDPSIALSVVIIAGLIIAAILSRHRSRIPLFSLLFFFLLLSPSFANFSRMGIILYASDRYLYLASIGLIVGVLAAINYASMRFPARGPWLRNVCSGTILAILAVLSFSRSLLWGDSERFFRTGIAHDPGNAVMHFNLGVVLHRKDILDEAMSEYAAAIKLASRYTDAYANLGVALLQTGRTDEAILILSKAVELDPGHEKATLALEQAKRL